MDLLRLKYRSRQNLARAGVTYGLLLAIPLLSWTLATCAQSPTNRLFIPTTSMGSGWYFRCFLNLDGYVKCWGDASNGSLGYANGTAIGDDETPASVGYVQLGEQAALLVSGSYHTCAKLYSGRVLCWGYNTNGHLGGGNETNIGDDEIPTSGTYLTFPETITSLAAGFNHTCALSTAGNVYCWGANSSGQLGYGHTNDVGDDEALPMTPVDLGGTAVQISGGNTHTCALLTTGGIKCWGANNYGQLGYGNLTNVGDGTGPAVSAVGEVSVGGTVTHVAAGSFSTCAVLSSGAVRCWGRPQNGQLGYGNATQIGDDEHPSSVGEVSIGETVSQMCTGLYFTCALTTAGNVRCWGANNAGNLGLSHTTTIGDNELPSSQSAIELGGTAQWISCSRNVVVAQGSVCAYLSTGGLRCWGSGAFGALGYGNPNNIGNDEPPSAAGDVPL